MTNLKALLWLAFFLAGLQSALAQEIVFASVADAQQILGRSDSYSQRMSTFDRAVRMGVRHDPDEQEYLAFASGAATAWPEDERAAVEAAYRDIERAIARLRLPLPARVYFVRTSGIEDAHAAYTRQNAIMLPVGMLKTMTGPALRRLVAHELFHVATRAHPELVDPLYAAIGFHRCGEVALPPGLASRRITNPDAPRDEHCIRVALRSESAWALPVLVSTASRDEILAGGGFLEYVTLVLLLVDAPQPGTVSRPRPHKDAAVVGVEDVTGFFEQIGRNTQYIIHPEEIVSDNFALLALGTRDVPSPHILLAIEKVLASYVRK
jgi:hypothetical protein